MLYTHAPKPSCKSEPDYSCKPSINGDYSNKVVSNDLRCINTGLVLDLDCVEVGEDLDLGSCRMSHMSGGCWRK